MRSIDIYAVDMLARILIASFLRGRISFVTHGVEEPHFVGRSVVIRVAVVRIRVKNGGHVVRFGLQSDATARTDRTLLAGYEADADFLTIHYFAHRIAVVEVDLQLEKSLDGYLAFG